MNQISRSVLESFTNHFSTQPKLFFSPGRINLIGEHVDYNDGFVMPAAINKGVLLRGCRKSNGYHQFLRS